MNSVTSVLAMIIILVLGAMGGLIYLGQSGEVPQQSFEKVLPNDQFPR